MPLSASSLLYLGADAVVPRDKKLSMGLPVPCRDTSVDLKQASAVFAAAALWSLRDAGAVTLGVEAKKGLFGSKQRLAVRRGGGTVGNGGIEAGLAAAVAEKDPWARDTVYRWLGRESGNPWASVVGAVEAELVAAGLLDAVEAQGLRGKLGAAASGRLKVTPRCDAVERVRGDVDTAVSRWQAFQTSERELAEVLVKECRDGVDARLATD
jgi:hypothetical protein